MKNWVLSIGITIIVISILTIILPSNKLGKLTKGIFSLIIILVIIQPIISFSNNNYQIGDIEYSEIIIQNDFIDYVNFTKIENLKQKCNQILKNYEIEGATVDILYENTNYTLIIEKCVINLSNAVINSNEEHIYIIKETKNLISELLLIDESKVIYEQ